MKKIAIIFLAALLAFIPGSKMSFSPSDTFVICAGEYVPVGLDVTTGQFYGVGTGLPVVVPGTPSNGAVPIGGPHSACGLTSDGKLFCFGQNQAGQIGNGTLTTQNSMVQISTDSLGNALGTIVQAHLGGARWGQFWTAACITSVGKLYVWGETEGGLEGNGTWGCPASTRPVQVVATGNPFFTKIQGGNMYMALDSTGSVWTWGDFGNTYTIGRGGSPNYTVPGKVTLPTGRRAVDIASQGNFSYILLDNGDLMATGQQPLTDYIGISPSGNMTTSFQVITSYISSYLPAGYHIAHVYVNDQSTYVLLTNGMLYGWGGSVTGTMGTGLMIDFSRYGCCPTPYGTGTPLPYEYDDGNHELQQLHPVRIAPGVTNFTNVLVGHSNSYYTYVTDANADLFGFGRNKAAAIINGVISASPNNGNVAAQYPDSWEVPYIQRLKPLALTSTIQVTCPYCIANPSGFPCNTFTNQTFQTVTASATATFSGGKIMLDGTASHCTNPLISYTWTQTTPGSDPATVDMRYQANSTDTIGTANGATLPTGTYHFQLRVVSSRWDSAFATVSVVVGSSPPTVSAGPSFIIARPTSSATLFGTATPNGGGVTITSTTWTFVSGPSTPTIVSPNSLTTNITGITSIGTYTFKLTATDSNGNSSSSTATIELANLTYMLRQEWYQHIYKVI